jgi:hypothetical protein
MEQGKKSSGVKMEKGVKKIMYDSACVVSNSRRFAYPFYNVPLL